MSNQQQTVLGVNTGERHIVSQPQHKRFVCLPQKHFNAGEAVTMETCHRRAYSCADRKLADGRNTLRSPMFSHCSGPFASVSSSTPVCLPGLFQLQANPRNCASTYKHYLRGRTSMNFGCRSDHKQWYVSIILGILSETQIWREYTSTKRKEAFS